ncbi:MAG TPA: caspase family protein, partial [Phycisphaerae bacterium]|nr:caspase family protein [Phycisphaerae bacterium]
MKRLAICLGLTRVDPAAYGGWDGDCPGADWDVNAVAGWCHAGLFDGVTALVNEFAQPAYLKPAFREAANSLVRDDLLVLFFSGHGGRRPDLDGDEDDGYDETLVLWDGQLVDDVIASYLRQVPAGVRIWFFTDSCHSGTNY